MPLMIFTSPNFFPPAVNSNFQFFMVSEMKFVTLSNILYILRQPVIQLCGTIMLTFLLSIPAMATFSASFCSLLECADQCTVYHLFLLFRCGIHSVLRKTVLALLASNRFSPLFVQLRYSTSWVDTLSIYSCWGCFLWVGEYQGGGLSLRRLIVYICFFLASILLECHFVIHQVFLSQTLAELRKGLYGFYEFMFLPLLLLVCLLFNGISTFSGYLMPKSMLF